MGEGIFNDRYMIEFSQATPQEIDDLIRLRLKFIEEDVGPISEEKKERIQSQLADYFSRKLGEELVAFVARAEGRMVAVVYLLMVEMPANANLLNGRHGEVLSVYTEKPYRGQGLCTTLMRHLLDYGKTRQLGRIDLSATPDGYRVYQKVGFVEKDHDYTDMRYKY